MTNEEAIQELFNLESGKYYDIEYVDEECFRIAIKAICNSDNVKAEIYPLKYDNLKLAQENSDLKKRIESLNNQVDWNLRKSDVEKNELKEAMTQYVAYYSEIIRSASKEITRLLKLNHKVNKRIVKLRADIKKLKKDLKKAMPFEFGQKLYSIETWPDTGDSTIFEYEFDGVEAAGIRLVYQGNKEDVCVFSLDEIGVNIFESMDEAEKVLKGGAD